MAVEPDIATDVRSQPREPAALDRSGMGATLVGPPGIALITAYLLLMAALLLYGLAVFWPVPIQPGGPLPPPSQPTFLFWPIAPSNEVRYLLIVVLAGALGSLVHALRSLYWYVGNRQLIWSWAMMYFLLPFVGSSLGLILYFVVRGGFFSQQAAGGDINPFGFAALACMAGLFSNQAMEKLRQVATTLLAEAPQGKDHVSPKEVTPKATIEVTEVPAGATQVSVSTPARPSGVEVSLEETRPMPEHVPPLGSPSKVGVPLVHRPDGKDEKPRPEQESGTEINPK
jgi:hypothetical protein